MGKSVRRILCKCVLGIGAIGSMSLVASPVLGNIMLFTTSSDFTGWTNGSATPAASTAYDFDGSTINGAGNNPGNSGSSINPGATSPGGSLQLTDSSALGYGVLAYSPGEAYNSAFMAAVDPGSTAAYSAASGFGPGSTVAVSGTMLLTYTIPTISAGSYLQIGVFFNDQADGYYHPELPSSAVSDGTVDGLSTYTATIPYTLSAGAGNLTNLNLGVFSNSDYVPTSPFYVDSIQVVTAPVPEPASILGITGAAGCAMLSRRRRIA